MGETKDKDDFFWGFWLEKLFVVFFIGLLEVEETNLETSSQARGDEEENERE